jgi:exodeoxyribonuclease X
MSFLVIDTETTGVEDKDKIVEIAAVLTNGREIKKHKTHLCNPGIPIPPEASAVHHLTIHDLEGHPPYEVIRSEYDVKKVTFVAHNAEFDKRMTGIEGDWICTYKCAYTQWPDAPGHSNQCLRYWLGLELPEFALGIMPHRALHDAVVTTLLFHELMEHMGPVQMKLITKQPLLLHKVTFGKHKGSLWSEVPKDYMNWCLKQADMDENVLHTCRHYLGG